MWSLFFLTSRLPTKRNIFRKAGGQAGVNGIALRYRTLLVNGTVSLRSFEDRKNNAPLERASLRRLASEETRWGFVVRLVCTKNVSGRNVVLLGDDALVRMFAAKSTPPRLYVITGPLSRESRRAKISRSD